MRKSLLVLFVLSLSHLTVPQSFELYEPISQFHADKAALERKYTLRETDEFYDRFSRLYNQWLEAVGQMDYNALDNSARIDYHIFRNSLQKGLYFHSLQASEFEKVKHVGDFAGNLYEFIRYRRRGGTIDPVETASLFHQMKVHLQEVCENMDQVDRFSSWMEADHAFLVIDDLRRNLEEAYNFYHGYHPGFTWWVEAPYQQLDEVLEQFGDKIRDHYSSHLHADDGSGIVGRPEGRDAIIKRLQYEWIPYTPEELLEIGRREFEWCRNQMVLASREMGFGDDWQSALEHVKNQFVPPGEQPQMINQLAEEAIAFIEENDLLTIPDLAKESWRMQMMSPERQLINPFFLGGEAIIISFPTHTMEHEAKMMSLRGNNPHFCMATVHHELIAGHHLQMFMMQRYKPYRSLMGTPFWIEGWALYWEFLLYEKGLPKTPEDKMGFLFWRKHRAARIVFSLQYHLGNMTPQQCIDYLVDEVGHERANAEAEVRRSFTSRYDPLYQLAYMIGGIQFQALREELVDSGQMSFREFHDRVLIENNISVELLREILLDNSLPKDFETRWRFVQ